MALVLGPLPRIETQVAAVELDVERLLRYPRGVTLKFLKPDASQVSKWATVKEYKRGFNRAGSDETVSRVGQTVVFHVADLDGTLAQTVELASYVLFMETLYQYNTVPRPSPDEAQEYVITCTVRTLKFTFFDVSR